MKFVVHTTETAPPASREDLETAEKLFGFIPNLLGVLAAAPIALEAYIILTKLLGDASLSPVEQQVVMLAGSHENGCGYCMAAHSTVAGAVGMPALILEALRGGTVLPDKKLEALRSFVIEVVRSRGRVSDERLEEFLAAGGFRNTAGAVGGSGDRRCLCVAGRINAWRSRKAISKCVNAVQIIFRFSGRTVFL